MKKLLLITSCCLALHANAQTTENQTTTDSTTTFNRWTLEAMTGFADGNYPYGSGFSAGDKKT